MPSFIVLFQIYFKLKEYTSMHFHLYEWVGSFNVILDK